MLLNPRLAALTVTSVLSAGMAVFACVHGVRILTRWDVTSGSELQLRLERRTYLVSTLVAWFLAFELVSLFAFVYTADTLRTLFVGVMCAAGSLRVNGYGYPALAFQVAGFLAAGVWLVVNHADSRGRDYPLLKAKYGLLVAAAPVFVGSAVLQTAYFAALEPDVIASCCGSLFGGGGRSLASELASLPPRWAEAALAGALAVTAAAGARFLATGRGALWLGPANLACFAVGLGAVVSFVSLYVYELPTHHCPFCLLQKEYGYLGYPLYLALFAATVAGLGLAALVPAGRAASLRDVVPALQRRLCQLSLLAWGGFAALVLYAVFTSPLVLAP